MDPFAAAPHLARALYCIAAAVILAVLVLAEMTADYHHKSRTGARRGKKWWEK